MIEYLTRLVHDWPCKNFHRFGVCSYGDACKFSHDDLSAETRKLLDIVSVPLDILYVANTAIAMLALLSIINEMLTYLMINT
jgi:Zinc finger C-x8-C-x5-C-x3-H type (and similar)